MSEQPLVEWDGFCPICDHATVFRAYDLWFRDHLICTRCPEWSIPRERALMLMMRRMRPDWARLAIHESSPATRGVSPVVAQQCAGYVSSQFFPGIAPGTTHKGFRCENLEAQTFPDESFDIVITQDVLEHVFHPDRAYKEIYRTLRPGGLHIHTTPVYSGLAQSTRKAELTDDGQIRHLALPEYHGNPVDDEGSLVTFHYGQDLPELIACWAPFDVEMTQFNDKRHGICGSFTEVIICRRS